MFPFKVRRLTEEFEKHVNSEAFKRSTTEYLVFKFSGLLLKVSMFLGFASILGYLAFAAAVVHVYHAELSAFQNEVDGFVRLLILLVLIMLVASATHDHFFKKLQRLVSDVVRDSV